MNWSFDISAAPRDGTHVILAMPNKITLRSYWCAPKGEPDHWCMLSHRNEPVAWMLWPEHPFLTKSEEEAEAKGAATVDAESSTEEGLDHQRALKVGTTDGRRQGDVEPLVAAMVPAPLIIHKHIFLDDVGGSL